MALEPATTEDRFGCRLPSAFTKLYFTARFTASVHHGAVEPPERHARLSSARQALRRTASAITIGHSPADPEGVSLDLDEVLRNTAELDTHGIRWTRCELTAPEEDVQRARQLELSEHEWALLESRHELTVRQASLLRDDVFSSGGQARLWWVTRFPDQIDRIPQLRDAFDEIVESVASPAPRSDTIIAQITTLCADLVRDLDDGARNRLGRLVVAELRQILAAFERNDLVEQLDKAVDTA